LRSFEGEIKVDYSTIKLDEKEKELIKQIMNYPEVIQLAAKNHSPALIANYVYDLVKLYNTFYQNVSILKAENDNLKSFRVQLSKFTANIISSGMGLLGINVPERM
jgi:arginyl-tRNA synthetase